MKVQLLRIPNSSTNTDSSGRQPTRPTIPKRQCLMSWEWDLELTFLQTGPLAPDIFVLCFKFLCKTRTKSCLGLDGFTSLYTDWRWLHYEAQKHWLLARAEA